MKIDADTVTINGQKYVLASAMPAPLPTGNRYVVVLDRNWVIAGDVTEENGRIIFDRAVLVQSWSGCGFDGMLRDPKSSAVKLKKLDQRMSTPADSEILRAKVSNDWGL